MHIKKIAMLYGLAGAGTAVFAYTKGYAFDISTLLLWPVKIMKVVSAPSVPAGSPRASLPS
jgi:hypothetical protein